MNIYLYWPFAREEDAEIFRAIPGDSDSVTMHTLRRPGALSHGSDRLHIRNDLPEVEPGLSPPSIAWLLSCIRTYRQRARVRDVAVRTGEFDIVHLAFLNRFTDIATVRRLSKALPLIVTVHDVVPHNTRLPASIQNRLLHNLYKNCDVILVHHGNVAKELTERFGVDTDRIEVVPMWITPHRRSTTPRVQNGRPLVLFVGSLRLNKGVDVLLDAIDRLEGHNVDFVIAGRGEATLERGVHEASRRNRCLTAEVGWVTAERKMELLNNADLVVLPYTSFSSQSAVLHDAYGVDVPVVGTDVGALGSSIRTDRTGRVARTADPGDLAETIISLLSNAEEWCRCSTAAQELAAKRSPQKFSRELRKVYERAINDHRRNRVNSLD